MFLKVFDNDSPQCSRLQAFKVTMRDALRRDEEGNPNNLTIESVLPGVNRRFDVLEQKIEKSTDASVDALGRLATIVEDSARKRNQVLITKFTEIAEELGDGREGRGSSESAAATDRNELLERVKNHKIQTRKPRTVREIYTEYYGLDDFKSLPVEGGIDSLEKMFKAKWRKSFTSADQKHFSRMQQLVVAIDRKIEDGRTKEELFREIDKRFEDVKWSFSGLITALQEDGFIERKGRRKRQVPALGGGGGPVDTT